MRSSLYAHPRTTLEFSYCKKTKFYLRKEFHNNGRTGKLSNRRRKGKYSRSVTSRCPNHSDFPGNVYKQNYGCHTDMKTVIY